MIARASTLFTLVAAGALASASTATAQDLTGAGSTFAKPIYEKWADAYAAKAGVKVNYQAIGSGGGINQLSPVIAAWFPNLIFGFGGAWMMLRVKT